MARPPAGLGDGPLDHLRHYAVAQRYPRRRPGHFLLREHFHQPADELDRRAWMSQDVPPGEPPTSLTPKVISTALTPCAKPPRHLQIHPPHSTSHPKRALISVSLT